MRGVWYAVVMETEINQAESQKETGLFFRSGVAFTGKPQLDEKGKPYVIQFKKCSRCGGAGGSDRWKFTGWTCFQCGGARGQNETIKLYTAEKISKMNAANDKRQAKKSTEREAQRQALEQQRTARRAEFLESNREYFASVLAVCGETSFAKEIIATATNLAQITENQRAALDKMVAESQRKAATAYVGEIGERRDFTCTLVTLKAFDGKFGRTYLHVMRDASGNAVKWPWPSTVGTPYELTKWAESYHDEKGKK